MPQNQNHTAEHQPTVMLIFGTRPEAIKMCPLAKELISRGSMDIKILLTSQHKELCAEVMSTMEINADYDLALMKPEQTLSDITVGAMSGIDKILREAKPDLVLVHGDTTTSYAAALSAFYLKIPVAHIEAGLRTHNIFSPFPEEFNRRAISLISSYDFAPTELDRQALLAEGKASEQIFVCGNTAIDALGYTVREDYTHELLEWAQGARLMLITAHRRENLGRTMVEIFAAIRNLLEENDNIAAIYPMHPNPKVRDIAREAFEGCPKIKLTEPLGMVDFHNIMARSYMILTDSGGIQEEAPALSVPVVLLRDTTERAAALECGAAIMGGTTRDGVYSAASRLLCDSELYRKMANAENPFGDGKASKRIADTLESILNLK